VAYELSLVFGYLIFGVNSIAPYLISSLFGVFWLISFYWLCQSLRANQSISLLFTLFFAIMPNFLYHNFLQTRNDYALAGFFALFFSLTINAIRDQGKGAFKSGVALGLATLMKLTAPGYAIWVMLIFLFIPYLLPKPMNFRKRVNFVARVGTGFLLASGWYYIPSFKGITHYHIGWQSMIQLKAFQYGLTNPADWILYYPNNLIHSYMPTLVTVIFGFIILVAIVRKRPFWIETGIALALASVLTGFIFLTGTGSIARTADLPWWTLVGAICVATISNGIGQIN